MSTMVREADGRVRSDRSITLRSIFSMDTGEEGPIEDGGGITWSSYLDDIVKDVAGAVGDAGSAGSKDRFVEEAEPAGSGGEAIGFDKNIGEEFRDKGLESEGPVEDSANSRIWGDEGSTSVRFSAVTEEAFEGRFLNVNFCLGAWLRLVASSLCLNELIACSPESNQNGSLPWRSGIHLPEHRSAVRMQ